MKLFKRMISAVLVAILVLTSLFSAMSMTGYAEEVSVPDAGSVYDDLPGDYGLLGIASQFHIFAKGKTTVNVHTNGNIATAEFDGKVNFGTNIHEGLLKKEIDYLQKVDEINSSSEIHDGDTRSTKLVVGKENTLALIEDGHTITLNDTKLDNLSPQNLYQDEAQTYIDFDSEFQKLEAATTELSSEPANVTITPDSFEDVNNQTSFMLILMRLYWQQIQTFIF